MIVKPTPNVAFNVTLVIDEADLRMLTRLSEYGDVGSLIQTKITSSVDAKQFNEFLAGVREGGRVCIRKFDAARKAFE